MGRCDGEEKEKMEGKKTPELSTSQPSLLKEKKKVKELSVVNETHQTPWEVEKRIKPVCVCVRTCTVWFV